MSYSFEAPRLSSARDDALNRIVPVDGGRRNLAVEVTGSQDGSPVIMMHGTPGSRIGLKPRDFRLKLMGVQLACYDRPGYGGSDRNEGRRVVDCVTDVAAIADALGYERFAIIGRSGGGAACPGVCSDAGCSRHKSRRISQPRA